MVLVIGGRDYITPKRMKYIPGIFLREKYCQLGPLGDEQQRPIPPFTFETEKSVDVTRWWQLKYVSFSTWEGGQPN